MRSILHFIRRFLSELRRRNVYQVAVTYVVVGFFVIEGADLTLTRLGLPPWTVTFVIVLVGLGFPIALVLAWALEVTPEGVRVEEAATGEADGPEAAPAPASTPRDLWVGASVLVLLLLGAWWMWGGLGSGETAEKTGGKAPDTQQRSIAVLPFEVSGAGAEEWRDGMVTMLSMNLDGAAGLRAIADRRIFAAAQQVDSMGIGSGQNSALTVAKQAGAKYAIVGSAVQLGEELRLGAVIRDVASEKILGEATVEGQPGTITTLTDRLTRKVLGVLLDRSEDRIPSVDLASITTSSLEALRAFLEGERRFRAGEYESAVESYRAAVNEDSTFALAHARRALAIDWWTGRAPSRMWARAHELSGRLPRRERRLVWAFYAQRAERRALAVTDSLRQWSKTYPDDPSVWNALGESIFHGSVPGGWREAERAFRRADELDPGVAPYHRHLVDIAFSYHRDSALAKRRVKAHPPGPSKELYRIYWDLVFGSEKAKEEAFARLDTTELSKNPTRYPLTHPGDQDLHRRVLLAFQQRTGTRDYSDPIVGTYLEQGRRAEFLRELEERELSPTATGCMLASGLVPLPDSLLRAHLEPSSLGVETSLRHLGCVGLYLVRQGRWEDHTALLSRIRTRGDKEAGQKPWLAERARLEIMELKGFKALKQGNLQVADRYWSSSKPGFSALGAIWRGDLYRKLGQLEKAEGWYLAAWPVPLVHERLGQLYEEMGEPEKARAAYERFIAAWEDADPELQGRVTEARGRVEALGEKKSGE